MKTKRHAKSGSFLIAMSGVLLASMTLVMPGCAAKAGPKPESKTHVRPAAQSAADAPLEQPDTPTEKDRADMAEFDRLAVLLDGGRGTEIFNLLRDPGEDARLWAGGSKDNAPPLALKRLAGKAPANKRQLNEARAILATNLDRLHITEKLALTRPIEVVKRRGAIKIDGKLDEAEWQRAAPVQINIQFKMTNTTPDPKHLAHARLMWDEDGLYLGYTIHDTTVHAGPGTRDDMSYLWDCIEVFVLVDPKNLIYWELNILASGAVNDVYCKKSARLWAGGRDVDATLEGVTFKVNVHGTADVDTDVDEGYVVEAFIPWKSLRGLEKVPVAGSEMKGVLAQADMKTPVKPENLSFFSDVPMIVGYQDVWNFRTWKFVEKK